MVPMRKIFESLDAKVDWEGTTQTITATKDNTEIVLQINNYTMYSNGVEETLDIAPVIINDSTFVPLRAVSQSLKASVEWFGYTHSVYINSPLTYSNEYKSYVDFFMQGAVPAGYELKDNVSADAVMHTDICVQGVVSDVNIKNNDVYLIVENRYTQGEKIAVYISDLESTSIEKMTEMFKGKNVSVGGRYLGYTNTFNSAAVNLRHIGVCETEEFYSTNELTYPLLSQIDEKVLLYDLSNQPQYIPATKVNEYIESGWTTEARVTMYAPDGRTISILTSEVESYKNVGWYIESVTTMYAVDGRTLYVPNSEVEAYQNVGWYLAPVTTMYASDGRTTVIYEDEIQAYKNVGWYETYDEAQAAKAPSYSGGSSYQSNYDNQPNSGGSEVYRTPSGKRYHFDPNCGGKNSYQTTLQAAKSAGLTPCKKCVY